MLRVLKSKMADFSYNTSSWAVWGFFGSKIQIVFLIVCSEHHNFRYKQLCWHYYNDIILYWHFIWQPCMSSYSTLSIKNIQTDTGKSLHFGHEAEMHLSFCNCHHLIKCWWIIISGTGTCDHRQQTFLGCYIFSPASPDCWPGFRLHPDWSNELESSAMIT